MPPSAGRVSGTRRDHQLGPLAEHDHDALRLDQGPASLDDQFEHSLQIRRTADRIGDVARGPERAHRLLELLATALAVLVQPRVLDRRSRPLRQREGCFLVLIAELAAALLFGEIQVAPGLAADHDRDPEEGVHRRVVDRKPVAVRVLTHLGEPQWLGVLDQRAEHPPATRKNADRPVRCFVDAEREEAFELGSGFVQHAQRGISRPGDFTCLVEDPLQHGLGVVLGHQLPANPQQAPSLVAF